MNGAMGVGKKEEEIKSKEMLDILEDDDEFAEFDQDDWDKHMEDPEDTKQWYHPSDIRGRKKEWDDDEPEDEFGKELRSQITTAKP